MTGGHPFNAVALLVSDAQEKLDQIEINVENTRVNVEAGHANVKKAEEYKRMTRSTKCKTYCLCLTILIVLLFAMGKWVFQLF